MSNLLTAKEVDVSFGANECTRCNFKSLVARLKCNVISLTNFQPLWNNGKPFVAAIAPHLQGGYAFIFCSIGM
jgi:hypothetical protein